MDSRSMEHTSSENPILNLTKQYNIYVVSLHSDTGLVLELR